LMGVI